VTDKAIVLSKSTERLKEMKAAIVMIFAPESFTLCLGRLPVDGNATLHEFSELLESHESHGSELSLLRSLFKDIRMAPGLH
jgi:hypothetical protein